LMSLSALMLPPMRGVQPTVIEGSVLTACLDHSTHNMKYRDAAMAP
jgi:hypothetical protein